MRRGAGVTAIATDCRLVVVTTIGLHLVGEDDPGDPSWLVPPSPLDVPVVAGRLTQERQEDLQLWSFLLAAGLVGGQHPLEVRRGEQDPPDRYLRGPAGEWALEMTELTAENVRGELAVARGFGRRLERSLRADPHGYAHLLGRRVVLALTPQVAEQSLPAGPAGPAGPDILESISEALAEDKGCVGDGVDLSAGFPSQWPNSAGFYGPHGPFLVQVQGDGVEGQITVVSSAQGEMRRSESLRALAGRLAKKDCPPNEALLISCGLPDKLGYVCGLDSFVFRLIAEAISAGETLPAPSHLSAVALHLWGTTELIQLHSVPDAPAPWSS
jgi:hypothetical protein